MPSWDNTSPRKFTCLQCGCAFEAKRTAKYCSDLCSGRSRPARESISSEKRAELRRRRLEKDGYRERINEQGRKRRDALIEFLNGHKMKCGCAHCGYKVSPVALEFHHVNDDKEFNISLAKSIRQAEREMEKCIVLCANCHRIHHWRKPAIFAATYEVAE